MWPNEIHIDLSIGSIAHHVKKASDIRKIASMHFDDRPASASHIPAIRGETRKVDSAIAIEGWASNTKGGIGSGPPFASKAWPALKEIGANIPIRLVVAIVNSCEPSDEINGRICWLFGE